VQAERAQRTGREIDAARQLAVRVRALLVDERRLLRPRGQIAPDQVGGRVVERRRLGRGPGARLGRRRHRATSAAGSAAAVGSARRRSADRLGGVIGTPGRAAKGLVLVERAHIAL
jgi:hypothetical protein